jgi:hypothetical protein
MIIVFSETKTPFKFKISHRPKNPIVHQLLHSLYQNFMLSTVQYPNPLSYPSVQYLQLQMMLALRPASAVKCVKTKLGTAFSTLTLGSPQMNSIAYYNLIVNSIL